MKKTVIRLFPFIFTLILTAACTEKSNEPEPVQPQLISQEYLYGSWSIDIDGNRDINVARIGLTFNKDLIVRDIDIVDIEHRSLLEIMDTFDIWYIERECSRFKEYGLAGQAIHMEKAGTTYDWIVNTVSNDSIRCETAICGLTVPFTLYRSHSECDCAPAISNDRQVISSTINTIERSYNIGAANYDGPDNSKWMEALSDRLKLCHIAIPGTHDSGTYGIKKYAQFAATTQSLSFDEQWKAGVRCYDLRTRASKTDTTARIYHGFIPCEMTFKDAVKKLMRLTAASKECSFLFVNTEDNPMGGTWQKIIDVIVRYLSLCNITFDTSVLDDGIARQAIVDDFIAAENEVKAELGMKQDQHIIIGYSPELTLGDARGKMIVINRMPNKQGSTENYPFIGSEIIGSFSGVKNVIEKRRFTDGRDSIIEHTAAIDISDIYSPNDYEDHNTFIKRKIEGVELYTLKGYQQRTMNLDSDILYFTSVSASFGDEVMTIGTPIPDYATVAEKVYEPVANMMAETRTCGLVSMDFAGISTYNRISTGKLVAILLSMLGETLHYELIGKELLFTAIDAVNALCTFNVNGDKMLSTVLRMAGLSIPLDSIRISPQIITDAAVNARYPVKLKFYPADATERTLEFWNSSNGSVAELTTNNEEAELIIRNYGNARINVKTTGGKRHSIYVVAPKGEMQAVDLGLSVLWADRNIGAALPECDGYYFTWGDIDPHLHNFVPSEYKYGSSFDTYYKYSEHDNLTALQNADDPAHMNLGNGWRMPTKAEVEELLDLKNDIEWEQYQRNGVNGYIVSHNDEAIFLPALGYMVEYDIHHDSPYEGFFWTRDLFRTAAWKWEQANCLYIRSSNEPYYGLMNNQRYYGMPIRPVKDR